MLFIGSLTLGFLGNQNQIGQRGARVLPNNRNSIRVTAECGNVLLGPSQRGDYILDAQIARGVARARLQEA